MKIIILFLGQLLQNTNLAMQAGAALTLPAAGTGNASGMFMVSDGKQFYFQ